MTGWPAERRQWTERFEGSLARGNALTVRSGCAYLCTLGSSELCTCDVCASEVACGHPRCFGQRLGQLPGVDDDDGGARYSYLCPACLQAHAEAVRLEPVEQPSEELLDAIDVAVGGASLLERLRPPISPEKTLEQLSALEVALLTIVGTPKVMAALGGGDAIANRVIVDSHRCCHSHHVRRRRIREAAHRLEAARRRQCAAT